MKRVYIVTHGDKFKGPNPAMTDTGYEQVRALRSLIPVIPSVVVIGAGVRHLDVAFALDLIGDGDMPNELTYKLATRFTSTVGGPESLEKVGGRDMVILPDKRLVPLTDWTGTEDGKPAMVELVKNLPDNAVICAGRPSVMLLGVKDAKSAAVYCAKITEASSGWTPHIAGISEIVATGVSEPGTV